jgi:hypothetical protein
MLTNRYPHDVSRAFPHPTHSPFKMIANVRLDAVQTLAADEKYVSRSPKVEGLSLTVIQESAVTHRVEDVILVGDSRTPQMLSTAKRWGDG